MVTAEHCIVYHFDRSGVHIAPPFDIHKNPETFARVLLSIASLKEEVLGLDTAAQWTIGEDGRRNKGTITVTEPSGVKLKYRLIKNDPESRRYTLRGRGTTCWRARLVDKEGVESKEDVIIKYSWQSDGRLDEHELLEEVKGLKGVGQMVTHGRNGWQTKEGRLNDSKNVLPAEFRNRTHTCVVLQGYGQSITHFENEIQLLEAFRDAIAGKSLHSPLSEISRSSSDQAVFQLGHRSIYKKAEIVHRDIFPGNLVLGMQDAEDGDRGLVIDFDMAVKENRKKEQICSDKRSVSHLLALIDSNLDSNSSSYPNVFQITGQVHVYVRVSARKPGERI